MRISCLSKISYFFISHKSIDTEPTVLGDFEFLTYMIIRPTNSHQEMLTMSILNYIYIYICSNGRSWWIWQDDKNDCVSGHMQIHIYIYTCRIIHNDIMIKDERRLLYCKGSKSLFKVLWWEGVGDRTELQYIDPTLMAVNVVSFSFSWCSTRGPGAQLSAECWLPLPHLISNESPKLLVAPRAPSARSRFPYHILSAPSLDSNSSGAPEGPFGLVWLSLPHLVYNSNWLLVLTELYNSSTPTQSPTQSLEWHVWSSSSGNNCHAVQRSLSSGASVYECIMGFFLPCPISSAKSHLRDFF